MCDCPICEWNTSRTWDMLTSDEKESVMDGYNTGDWMMWEIKSGRFARMDGAIFLIDVYPLPQ